MSFLEGLGKKLQETTQNVVKGTKDFTDTARLNSLIADERRKIEKLYVQIGKMYYETHTASEESPSGQLCMEIDGANAAIAKYEQEILQIKGIKKCPACSGNVPAGAVFCSGCGAKVGEPPVETGPGQADAIKRCAGCGMEIEENITFCTACGQKVE